MPPKKGGGRKPGKGKAGPKGMSKPIAPGLVVSDLVKKEWKLGPVIGQGGFGYIYLGSKGGSGSVTLDNAQNVIKVEPHENGPLFVELAFYHRVAKPEMIAAWAKSQKKKHVGVPVYVGSGSFDHEGCKYRFMVMDRFGTDVEKIYKNNDFQFPEKTVFSLGLRILDALEYIHEKEYVHADIKSSNLMMGFSKDKNKVYLLDYGLAYRYLPGGKHIPYKEDPKRRHDGTIEYTSRDAHRGCAPSRRGDLEILGYCMVQWLCKKLPWEDKLNDKEYVMKEKIRHMNNIPNFMKTCFPSGKYPPQLAEYLKIVADMDYEERPNYPKVQSLFAAALKSVGGKDDGASVFLPNAGTPKGRKKRPSTDETSPAKKVRQDAPPKNSPLKETPRKRNVIAIVSPAKARFTPKNAISPKRVASPRKAASPKNLTPAERKIRTSPRSKQPSISNGHANILNEHDNILDSNTGKVIHRRPRKKNVKMVDFAQSP